MDPAVIQLFSDKQLRLTQPRSVIFDALKTASRPLSVVELIALCPTVNATSVYRTVNLFIELSIITAISHGWKRHYELTTPFRPHHHHLYCTSCQHHTEIHSKQLEALIATISEEHGFAPQQHHFEISGLCERCQADHTTTPSVN